MCRPLPLLKGPVKFSAGKREGESKRKGGERRGGEGGQGGGEEALPSLVQATSRTVKGPLTKFAASHMRPCADVPLCPCTACSSLQVWC